MANIADWTSASVLDITLVLETQRDQLFCLSKLVLANSFILIYM